jgi:ABC-type multidrug transport system ATPase subunit
MNALIGPSGCGKTTLVKAMLGLVPVDPDGEVWLDQDRITRAEDLLGRVGFAPQFSIAQPKLTVEECLRYALDLCVSEEAVRAERLERVLGVIGLAEHRHKRVESLSGGQLRRLGLGLELTVDPPTLICDEVTSGLDPLSETIILDLLRGLVRERGKTIICIIHNLAKLTSFDWITVVYAGEVVFQGDNATLLKHFEVTDALRLYDALNAHPVAYWRERWTEVQAGAGHGDEARTVEHAADLPTQGRAQPPGALSQFMTLLHRRGRLFLRDNGYLSLVLAITFGFPVMVVIFALGGLPQISSPSLEPQGNSPEAMMAIVAYGKESVHTASLVTGLIMFQVILLTLMGANNGAREIAAERLLYEKERLTGLRPEAYTASKLFFTGVLAAFQGAWMTAFVKVVCAFPGPWITQTAIFSLSCVAMTWVCVAFSAMLASPEKASTLSIYLVGFQLPLSGVVLALPSYLVWVCRPFINAYWGWAGYFSSMEQTRLYDAYTYTNPETLVASPVVAAAVLLLHALIGAGVVYWGCRQRRWNA